MRDPVSFADRLPPDSVARLERAAEQRYATAEVLRAQSRSNRLVALYLYGYCAEMWLSAAYFRSAGFSQNDVIERGTRYRRMAQARQLRQATGDYLMSGDSHPIVGWARFLEWQRSASGSLAAHHAQRLREAINKAKTIYNHWRPELRYKAMDIPESGLKIVREATTWFKDNHDKLVEA